LCGRACRGGHTRAERRRGTTCASSGGGGGGQRGAPRGLCRAARGALIEATASLGGEDVAALVLAIAAVALDPEPLHLVLPAQLVELLPQVAVLDRGLVARHPAAPLPPGQPLRDERLA